jgi:hypothetical protein
VIGDLVLRDVYTDTRQQPLYTSLPLKNVQAATSLEVTQTGLRDMSSFSGLKCLTRSLSLSNNLALTSLAGLQNLLAVNTEGPQGFAVFVSDSNPLLVAPSGFVPATRFAGCPGSGAPLAPDSIYVSVPGCSRVITTYSALCSWIAANTICP